ncbi:MAG: hypothetical protein ACQCN3_10355 [Candidatus Bathyarchaeia archaeon]|jgi:hypothetical protein
MLQLEQYLSKYITKKAVTLEKYVLEAFNNKDQQVLCMESFQGTLLATQGLRDCEFLRDANIFTEEVTMLRNKGHNSYRVFRLTPKGRELAENLQQGLQNKQLLTTSL